MRPDPYALPLLCVPNWMSFPLGLSHCSRTAEDETVNWVLVMLCVLFVFGQVFLTNRFN
jgi:hypothetical protein